MKSCEIATEHNGTTSIRVREWARATRAHSPRGHRCPALCCAVSNRSFGTRARRCPDTEIGTALLIMLAIMSLMFAPVSEYMPFAYALINHCSSLAVFLTLTRLLKLPKQVSWPSTQEQHKAPCYQFSIFSSQPTVSTLLTPHSELRANNRVVAGGSVFRGLKLEWPGEVCATNLLPSNCTES